MFSKFLKAVTYRIPSYVHMNDRMSYIDFINRKYAYEEVTILPLTGLKHRGNLYALFIELGIPDNLLPYALYLNGFTNPTTYDGTKLTFKIPKMPPIPSED